MTLGRVITVFEVDCRFGMSRGPFVVDCNGLRAAVSLLAELSGAEFVDPTNALSLVPPATIENERPVALPVGKSVSVMGFTVVPGGIDLGDAGTVKAALEDEPSLLAIYGLLDMDPPSLRSRLGTRVAIALECEEGEWRALPPGNLDERHGEVWDEFVRTYHMVTSDLRPPFWSDGHRLMLVKQGWVAYSQVDLAAPWEARIGSIAMVQFDRSSVSADYSQDGKFTFDVDAADRAVRGFLSRSVPVPLARITLASAQRAVGTHRLGRIAIVECATALEIAVSEVVSKGKLLGGVSKKKLDEYEKEVGLGYQLNVELPLFLAPVSDADRQVIGAADWVRKRRNEIVHKGGQATREEGYQAVESTRTLLDMLAARGYLF